MWLRPSFVTTRFHRIFVEVFELEGSHHKIGILRPGGASHRVPHATVRHEEGPIHDEERFKNALTIDGNELHKERGCKMLMLFPRMRENFPKKVADTDQHVHDRTVAFVDGIQQRVY